MRIGPIFLKSGPSSLLLSGLKERKMANSPRAFPSQTGPEGCRGKAGRNGPIRPATFQFTGGGAFQLHAQIVQTAWPREPGIQSGVQDGLARAEQFFHVSDGDALQKVFWCHPCPGREKTVEM